MIKKQTTDDQKELFVVVDKNDQVIGYQPREKCHGDKSLIHRVVGVVITNSKGEILLQKRSQTKDFYPGFYTLAATGHLTKGENYRQAAQREIEEELGVTRKISLKFFKKMINFHKKETHIFAVFTAEDDGPFNPNPKEIELIEFFSKKKIKNLFQRGKLLLTLGAKKVLSELKVL